MSPIIAIIAIIAFVGGGAGLLVALGQLFKGEVKEFLICLMFSAVLLLGGYSALQQRSPVMEKIAQSVEAERRRMESFRADQQLTADLRRHTSELESLARRLAESVQGEMKEFTATSTHLVEPSVHVKHIMYGDHDGVIFLRVSDWRTYLSGRVVVPCRFDSRRGWLVETVKAEDFRNLPGELHHSEQALKDLAEMYEIAVVMFQKAQQPR